MKLFEIGEDVYVNIEFIAYIYKDERKIELINGDKICLCPDLFVALLNTLKCNTI